MFIPLLAVPLAVQLIAAGDGIPKLDVTASCRGAAEAGYVTTTREPSAKAASTASTAPATSSARTGRASRPALVRSASRRLQEFAPTYTELATCLEMRRDLAKPKPREATTNGMAPPRQR